MSWAVGAMLAGASSLLGSCFVGGTDVAGVGGSSCVEGQTAACRCEDGRSGVAVCEADGSMTACACASGGTGGTGTGGAGGDTTTGEAASGGKGGSTGGGGGTVSGGTGATGGQGGVGGEPDEPDAGQDSGAMPTEDAGKDAGGVPAPGEVFAPCESTVACDGELECAAVPFGAAGLGYCAVRCRSNLGMMVADCPDAPPSGTVVVNCGFIGGLCQLGSCQAAKCPHGMECKEQFVPTPPLGNTVYYCAYPK